MFRKATMADVDSISRIYDQIHTQEEAGLATIGWVRSIYPTRATAVAGIEADEMFVAEVDGVVVAAARINQIQCEEYAKATWNHPASDEQVMVLHTLVVSPLSAGKGYGTKFVDFYENYALEHGCPFLRMDTNLRNVAARTLYKRLGYEEIAVIPTVFNGIEGVQLVCLEKKL